MADSHSPARYNPMVSMEHRLERLERHPNLLELREKNRSILAVPTMEQADETPDFDLTQAWSLEPNHTAHILAATWTTAQTGADPEPIRQHYRETKDPELRKAIAHLMTDQPRRQRA